MLKPQRNVSPDLLTWFTFFPVSHKEITWQMVLQVGLCTGKNVVLQVTIQYTAISDIDTAVPSHLNKYRILIYCRVLYASSMPSYMCVAEEGFKIQCKTKVFENQSSDHHRVIVITKQRCATH